MNKGSACASNNTTSVDTEFALSICSIRDEPATSDRRCHQLEKVSDDIQH